jgi:hypothetical protein
LQAALREAARAKLDSLERQNEDETGQ